MFLCHTTDNNSEATNFWTTPVSDIYYSIIKAVHFTALTLLVGRQEGHLTCKNWVVGCWCGFLSGARYRLAYGPADACATHVGL